MKIKIVPYPWRSGDPNAYAICKPYVNSLTGHSDPLIAYDGKTAHLSSLRGEKIETEDGTQYDLIDFAKVFEEFTRQVGAQA